MTTGDVLGWMGVITVFLLFWVIIYFFWRRARQDGQSGSATASVNYIIAQIHKLDREIQRLLKMIDELKRQRQELKAQAQQHARLRYELEQRNAEQQGGGGNGQVTPLLVAIGSDKALDIDLASLRAVETETGMPFRRIGHATLDTLRQRLARGRLYGRPYDKLHLAVHSVEQGIELGGQIVDSADLSEVLRGVRVLLLAGCEGTRVGDFLGVVPYVVTLDEKVTHDDAALFTRVFWTQIGYGLEPGEAVEKALERAPSGMNEYVEQHF
jgi:hypothetical protein